MSLSCERATAVFCVALTGGFTATALADRHSRPRAARLAWLVTTVCGALAVTFEERAQELDARRRALTLEGHLDSAAPYARSGTR